MATEDWAPTVADVGAVLRARTKDDAGNELGTFTEATRPTGAEVEHLIAGAGSDVASIAGDVVGDNETWTDAAPLRDRARDLTALGTALVVELSYFPEQVATGRSPYAQLKTLYDERATRFAKALAAAGDPDVQDGDGAGALSPSTGFAPWGAGRTDWCTRF